MKDYELAQMKLAELMQPFIDELTPEQRLAGLTAEELVRALTIEELVKVIKLLPPELQEQIKQRL